MLDSVITFDAALYVEAVHRLAKLTDFKLRDQSFLFQIVFIANYDDILDRELAVIVVLVNPLIQMVEAVRVGDVEDEHTAVCSSVITSS